MGLIVHEWIEPTGGAERVVDEFVEAFPGAGVVCLWNDAKERYPNAVVRETWLSKTPLRKTKALALLVMPFVWRTKTYDSDWVLVSSHAFAHHVKVSANTQKYLYVHTPARYIWAPELDSRGNSKAAKLVAAFFKPLDKKRAGEAFSIAANSEFVAERIKRSWGKEAVVIHPPVAVAKIQSGLWRNQLTETEKEYLGRLPQGFIMGLSRFVPYKRLETVIEVAEKIGSPVVIAGSGPQEQYLKERAAISLVDVQVILRPSDAMVYALMEKASLFVFPPIEDFGIVPVEAMALGTPVLANVAGGAGESVKAGVSGSLFDPDDLSDVATMVDEATGLDSEMIKRHAMKFDNLRFEREIKNWILNADFH